MLEALKNCYIGFCGMPHSLEKLWDCRLKDNRKE